jgi:Rubisco Assembly chaperone C-terminal domain
MCSAAEKGLSVAVSPTAVERLLTLRQAKKDAAAKAAEAGPTAKMASVRLTKDDIGARLIPLAGTLGQATADVRPVLPERCLALATSTCRHLFTVLCDALEICSRKGMCPPSMPEGWTPLTAIMMPDLAAQAVVNTPVVGGNGIFQAIQLPEGGGQGVCLPRWNILALARRPAALFVNNAAAEPEIVESFANVKVWQLHASAP